MNKDEKRYQDEMTLVIIKPDGVQRALVGEIISRFEKVGLKIVTMKMVVASVDQVEEHYTVNPDWKKNVGLKNIESYSNKGLAPPSNDPEVLSDMVLTNLKKYITSGPVVLLVLQGAHAVALVRKIIGGTEPLSSDVGTIRGDYVLDSFEMADGDGRAVRNLIHASGSRDEAEAEIKVWLDESELLRYGIISDKILYDVDIDGIIE